MSYIWLSHTLKTDTPLYGGQKGMVRIDEDKSILAGDSCNTSHISLPTHAGTHVDSPKHFFDDGLSIEMFEPNYWIFNNPVVVNIHVDPDRIICSDDVKEKLPKETDICLFKTGFEKLRQTDTYWKKGPGVAPEMAELLKEKCPGIKAIGMDFISISSLCNRQIGRQAHRAFLERGILIIEDMKLGAIKSGQILKKIICLPLRIINGDGAPCSILGSIRQN
jgi:kynurenine formamidase